MRAMIGPAPSPHARPRLPRAQRQRWRAGLLLAGLLAAGAAVAAAQAVAQRLTLIEGEAVVIDGARALAGAPGLALAAGAIVETGDGSRLVRIEFADGSIVDLGPATRVMVAPPRFAARDGKPPALYLLAGWVKQASPGAAPAAGLVTPALDLRPFTGAVVVHAAAASRVFVETGRAALLERRRGGATLTLAAGEMYAADAGAAGSVQPRPAPDFVAAMPRMFRDRIPSQAARFQDVLVEATPLPPPDYARLRPWLGAEPQLRREFPRRFVTLARQPAFRRALEDGLAQHPEWMPILYPPPPRKTP